jgi:AAA ATPase domain
VIPEPNFPAKPEEFVGRRFQIEAFRRALRQGLATGRTPSFAVLGEWGIGKSSLLLKCSAICAEPEYNMLPVPFSVSKELADYRSFAEGLLDTFSEVLAHSHSATVRLQRELQSWKLSRVSIGALSVDRNAPQFFLSSGTAILKHSLRDAWRRFIQPAGSRGVIFFLDDLHNLASPSADAIALSLRDQFQSFAVDGLNCSVCFSAPLNYFPNIRSFAEPAVRFYDKVQLEPFTPTETSEYVAAVFGPTVANFTEFSEWLHEKTQGHPYFMAFIAVN